MSGTKYKQGFTIVELLIVIVVIAILAAISIVAYNGIQDRANDTAIKSDISNNVKQIELYAAENGEYPKGGSHMHPLQVRQRSVCSLRLQSRPMTQRYFNLYPIAMEF